MIGKLRSAIPGQGFSECGRELPSCLDERIHHNICSLLGEFNQDDESRLPFDQRGNEGPAGALHQIAFPIFWDRSIFDLRRPLAYGDCIGDPLATAAIDCMARPTTVPSHFLAYCGNGSIKPPGDTAECGTRGLKHPVEVGVSLAQFTADSEDRLASVKTAPELLALRGCNCRIAS